VWRRNRSHAVYCGGRRSTPCATTTSTSAKQNAYSFAVGFNGGHPLKRQPWMSNTPSDVTSAAAYTLRLLARRIQQLTSETRDLEERIADEIAAHYPHVA
jgi:hypothetical protein